MYVVLYRKGTHLHSKNPQVLFADCASDYPRCQRCPVLSRNLSSPACFNCTIHGFPLLPQRRFLFRWSAVDASVQLESILPSDPLRRWPTWKSHMCWVSRLVGSWDWSVTMSLQFCKEFPCNLIGLVGWNYSVLSHFIGGETKASKNHCFSQDRTIGITHSQAKLGVQFGSSLVHCSQLQAQPVCFSIGIYYWFIQLSK